MDAADKNSMLTGSPVVTFYRYGIPWALGFLLLSSAGLVDAFFIGHYAGANALAAVNLVTPMFSFFFGVGIMLSVGGTVQSAKYVGEGNMSAASAMFSKAMLALLGVAVVFSGVTLALREPLIRFLGANGELAHEASVYLTTLMCFGPILPCSYALSQFVRVDQHPSLASFGLVLSAGINIILDYWFIAVNGWGVLGAALATGIGYGCTLVLFLGHFLSRRANLRLCLPKGDWKELFVSSANGAAECINELSIGTVILFINRLMIDRFGGDGVAAFTIVNYASWFGLTLAYGLSDTLAPLVSANYGARLKARIRILLYVALLTLFGLGCVMFMGFTLLPDQIIAFFLPGDAHVAAIAEPFISGYRWGFLWSGINMGLVCYFTGLHMVKQAMLLAVLRSLIFPVLFLATLPQWWGEQGIYFAIPLTELLTFACAVLLFVRSRRSHFSF